MLGHNVSVGVLVRNFEPQNYVCSIARIAVSQSLLGCEALGNLYVMWFLLPSSMKSPLYSSYSRSNALEPPANWCIGKCGWVLVFVLWLNHVAISVD